MTQWAVKQWSKTRSWSIKSVVGEEVPPAIVPYRGAQPAVIYGDILLLPGTIVSLRDVAHVMLGVVETHTWARLSQVSAIRVGGGGVVMLWQPQVDGRYVGCGSWTIQSVFWLKFVDVDWRWSCSISVTKPFVRCRYMDSGERRTSGMIDKAEDNETSWQTQTSLLVAVVDHRNAPGPRHPRLYGGVYKGDAYLQLLEITRRSSDKTRWYG